MYNSRKSIAHLTVKKEIKFHKIAFLIPAEFIVERGISSAPGFQAVEEVINDFVQWKNIIQVHSSFFDIIHIQKYSSVILAKFHDRTDIF